MVIQMPLSDVPEGCEVYCPSLDKACTVKIDFQRNCCTWIEHPVRNKPIPNSKNITCYVDEDELKAHVLGWK